MRWSASWNRSDPPFVKAVLALVIALAVPCQALAASGPGNEVATRYARPALGDLERRAQRNAETIELLCRMPDVAKLEAARRGFAETAAAFGTASALRFGPLADENRFERLFFWPDARGIALRQVQSVLAEGESGTANLQQLADRSAAIQGIPALDYVLFGSGSDALAGGNGAFRCSFAAALAGNVAQIAGQALEGWSDDAAFMRSFADPAAGHQAYRSPAEVDGEIVKAMSTLLRYIVAAELRPPLGASAEKANGRRAPLWRSRTSFDLVIAQLDGLGLMIAASGFRQRLSEEDAYGLDSIEFEIRAARAALAAITENPEEAFANPSARGRIAVAVLALEHAVDLVGGELSSALGLTMGFNALDGD